MNWRILVPAGFAAWFLFGMAQLAEAADVAANYKQHCAACHGPDRLGGIGPALIPENLARLRKPEAEKVIREGRPATQMLGFGQQLNDAEIKALVEHAYTPIKPMPAWGEAEIKASRIVNFAPGSLPDKPQFKADPLNLFVVVETGDHHVSILDGDKLEPIHRFPSRFALHGGPKFTPDGRYVFFASRDGWITKFDLWNLKVIAEVRAGINTRNAAVSGDGKWVAVANYLPHSLVILDADLNLKKILPVTDKDGKTTSRVSAVYDAAPRQSFVAALKDVKEVWEVSYNPKADDISAGMIHDFKYREGKFIPGFLNPQRSQLDDYLDDFYFTQGYDEVMGASRNDAKAAVSGQVVNLDARKKIADLELPGMPHLGSGISWQWQGKTVMATPNLNEGPDQHHRHADLEDDQADQDPRPRLLHAQPRKQPLCVDRFDDEQGIQGHHADHRQGNAGNRRRTETGAGQDLRPRRVHERRQVRAGQPVGNGRRTDHLRRGDAEGS